MYRKADTKLATNLKTDKYPDESGRFGDYGGRYIPETLMPAVYQLEEAYNNSKKDEQFQREFSSSLRPELIDS